MTPSENPYEGTVVAAERSMGEIRNALRDLGALRVSFEDEERPPCCRVRALIPSTGEAPPFPVRFDAYPLAPSPPGPRGGKGIDAEQRRKQAWRALAWYVSSMAKAATFGLIAPEQAFLAFIEQSDGSVIGDVAIPALHAGLRQIEAVK